MRKTIQIPTNCCSRKVLSLLVDVERTVKEKIGGKRYGEVRNFKKVRKFASSNLKFRSSKFKFIEILICNPGLSVTASGEEDLAAMDSVLMGRAR